MLEQDYLMRMIMQLVNAIVRSMGVAGGGDAEDKAASGDPLLASKELEAAMGDALGMDSSMVLSLAPESVASVLSVSGSDPALMEYVGRMMALESEYLRQAGQDDTANLRLDQAKAIADAFGFEIDASIGAREAMEAFLESQRENASW